MDDFTIDTVAHRFADLYEQLVSDAAPEPASRVAEQT
jgi:hypothetical protein